ncbi:MAG: type II secretion system F family protein [Kiritimatiellaeota bacterium]|nr:type II secretion system F family protein [Kiritimatiellota bacterium]
MARFKYVAVDSKGKETQGEIEGDSQAIAIAKIREQQLYPTKLIPLSEKKPDKKAEKDDKSPRLVPGAARKGKAKSKMSMEIKLPAFLSKVKSKELMTFTRQLATLIDAGLPLLRGLQIIIRQEKNPLLKKTTQELAESIESGSTFAEALASHPKIFNKLYVNMVRAGEIGGVLDTVLMRLAEFMEKAQRIKSKVTGAMVYPVVVLIMAIGILLFLMTFIVPRFADIFKDLLEGASLPTLTMIVMKVSDALTKQLPYVVIGIVAFVIGIRIIAKTSFGRLALDKFKLTMPIFGVLVQKTAISRFSRTLGTLMSSGVPVLQALSIVKETSGNEAIGRAIQVVHDSVKEGENMAPPIESCSVFPPMVVGMVEAGEETGKLPEMLMKIADSYDDDVDATVQGLTSIIEPLLIIFLALIVGTIVIALFLPLIEIIKKLGGGG